MVLHWAETKGGREEDESGVYLSNVSEEVTSDFVRKEFAKFGEIREVRVTVLLHDTYTHVSPCFRLYKFVGSNDRMSIDSLRWWPDG